MYATLSAQLCGGLYKYFRDIFTNEPGTDSFEIMNTEAEKLSPGSEGIIILPYFQGERTPIWDPYARGMIFGLSLNHKKGHLVRAIMEAAGYAFRHNYIVLKKGGLKINLPFTVSEGGAKSRLWRQIVSDMLEEQLILRNSESCASFGSAIIAGVGTGVFNDFSIIKKWLKVADRVEPIIENSDIYKKYYKVFLNLYSSNKNIFPELAILLETSRNNKIDR
jgi:xylulokinase